MYSDNAEFWHPLFIVRGRENIFGAHMFWSFINRKTEARVKRLGGLLGLAAALALSVPLQHAYMLLPGPSKTERLHQAHTPQAIMHGCYVASC